MNDAANDMTGIKEIASATPAVRGPDKLAIEQIQIFDDLDSKRRAERDDDFQTIAQYALPQESDITTKKTEGVAGWTDRIFDTTTIRAVEVLATGLYNWWTPQSQPWAEYAAPRGIETQDDDDTVKWLGKASDMFMDALASESNFYMTKATGDTGLATFATDCIIMDEAEPGDGLFNFTHWKIGTYVIEENYRGIVDTARQVTEMTYRQICQKFNRDGDNIPQRLKDAAKGEKGNRKKFKIMHCIFPRDDSKRLKNARTGPNKPIASVFVAYDFKECIRIGGYDESPILCRRFKKWATVWGYGPCYLALPDSRQVNYVQQNMDAAAEILVNPRVLVPNEQEGDIDLRAGGVSSKGTDANDKPESWATDIEYKLGLDLLDQKRTAIKEACFVDAFKLLNSAPLLEKEMTAYEVSQRQAEQLQGMTAIDARQIPEFINPLCLRGFGIMVRRGRLKDPPQALMTAVGPNQRALLQPRIVVTSRFNDALKALKNRGFEELVGMGMKMVEMQKPEALDVIDWDSGLAEYGRNAGNAPDLIRSMGNLPSRKATVADIRSQRAKLQAAQRQAQMAEQLGKAGKALGGSPQWMQDQVQDQAEQAQGNKKVA